MGDSDAVVNYTVKELVARLEGKVDRILDVLDHKVDAAVVDALTTRLEVIELDLAITKATAKKTRTLLFVGVPGFVSFIGAVIGLVGFGLR